MATNTAKPSAARYASAALNAAIHRDCDNIEGPLKKASMITVILTIVTFIVIVFTFFYNYFYKGEAPKDNDKKPKIVKIGWYIAMLTSLLAVLSAGYMFPNVKKVLTCPPTTN